MMSRMVGSVLTLVILLLSAGGGAAQTYTQMQWGMNKGVTPYQFGANINGTWSNLGTVSSAGVWNLTIPALPGLSTNVQGTGMPGLDGGRWFIFQNLTSPPTDVAMFRKQYQLNYTGGATGNVYTADWNLCTASVGVKNFLFCGLDALKNYSEQSAAEIPGHTARYAQAWNYTSNGGVWAAVNEARDMTGNSNPTKNLTGLEVDVFANGTDDNQQRSGLQVVGGKGLPGSPASVAYSAIQVNQINSDDSQGSFLNGLLLTNTFNVGINLAPGTFTSQAIAIPANSSIAMDATCTGGTYYKACPYVNFARKLFYNNGFLIYSANNNYVFQVADNGDMTSYGKLSLGLEGAAIGSVAFKNATSGSITLEPATGALGTVTATLPANTGTIAETNLAQTFSATQTFTAPIVLASYTIGALPTCNAGALGSIVTVSNGTDYATGTYGSAVSATGIVTRSVLCTNTAGATTYAWAYN